MLLTYVNQICSNDGFWKDGVNVVHFLALLLTQVCFIYFQVLSITTLCPGIGFGLACDTLMSQVCEKCPSSPFSPPPVVGNWQSRSLSHRLSAVRTCRGWEWSFSAAFSSCSSSAYPAGVSSLTLRPFCYAWPRMLTLHGKYQHHNRTQDSLSSFLLRAKINSCKIHFSVLSDIHFFGFQNSPGVY